MNTLVGRSGVCRATFSCESARGRRIILFVTGLVYVLTSGAARAEDRAQWLRDAKWGVMSHYLADWIAARDGTEMNVDRWNRLVDAFDTERLADQLESIGARYYIFTIGQNSGYYLAPNRSYDQFVGRNPSRCSRRDLVSDLSASLRARGIRLLAYLPSGAAARDSQAGDALQWQNGAHRNLEFQAKWEQVIRQWSERWGDGVAGWWFDGCYWPNAMYRHDAPNFASFAAAARAGNPDAIVAFNPGVFARITSISPDEDFTAGEINDPASIDFHRIEKGRRDGAQLHVLSLSRRNLGSRRTPLHRPTKSSSGVAASGTRVARSPGTFHSNTTERSRGLSSFNFRPSATRRVCQLACVRPLPRAANKKFLARKAWHIDDREFRLP